MAPRCFCGGTFSTIKHLRDHVEQKGHRFMCSCGRLYKSRDSLRTHWASAKIEHPLPNLSENPALVEVTAAATTTNGGRHGIATIEVTTAGPSHSAKNTSVDAENGKSVFPCSLCNKKLKSNKGLEDHVSDKYPVCPDCHQAYATRLQLHGHQKAANHYYCQEHDQAFPTQDSFPCTS
ncbi:hypothetical protein EJ03DRAFT_173554 [Teratosphaeria nubilosa]|uniref:C2H2-type domain-containing protein n=1 Tax=Teratosphaeria nubilosa TaxID=161662 RepID=A0A6G1L1J1_9PEZI|nr:hypothetical protein EJ03DRAFT_173554 [Teratosphaeria nubilosa]